MTGGIGQGGRSEASEGIKDERQEGNPAHQAAAAPAVDGMNDIVARMEDLKARNLAVEDAQVCICSAA